MTATAPPRRVASHQRLFRDLSRSVKQAGLMERRALTYLPRAIVLVAGLAVALWLLLTLGPNPWQLAVAALFGVLFTQVAFLGHDAAHQQVFASARRNEWLSALVANLVVGLSHGWWARKHGKHHANPNTIGKDGDIATGALVYDPDDTADRQGFMGWVTRRQGWLFFPLLTFLGVMLHYKSVRSLVRGDGRGHGGARHRGVEGTLLGLRLIGFPLLVILTLGPALGLGFLAIQVAVFGVYMGLCFAPNHKGMPLIGPGADVDFLRRQVLTSRNVRGRALVTWAMGGLNYQIEHHLFPRMPSPALHRVAPLVREFCAAHAITYTETSLIEAYTAVIRYLHRVGIGHIDPFDCQQCPLVADFRAPG